MNGDDHLERRAVINVTDKPIELQSMAQTVLTFLLLAVMSWVGLTLEEVKDNTAILDKSMAVFANEQTHLAKDLKEHIKNPRAHQ